MRPRTLGPALALVLGLGTLAAAGGAAGEAETLSAGFRKAAKAVLPAVVTVRASGPRVLTLPPTPPGFAPFPGRPAPEPSPPGEEGGSGVVVDAAKGFVLTNDHVVQGADRVVVTLHDGRERKVTEVRRDPKSDLALLVIDAQGLTQAEWGDSEALDTGDWVLAVGQPFGLSGTVTAGIVSGKSRGVGASLYEDLIQTDAAINPGNSGGPLVGLDGRVVGINTAIKTRRGGYEGVGFAVPASRAKRVAADLARSGSVRRAFLGVAIETVDPATGEKLGQPGAVVINDVAPGTAAEKAGLRRGDIITRAGGRAVGGLGALQSLIEFAEIGEPLTLTVDRGGTTQEIEVRPEVQPERLAPPDAEPAAADRGGAADDAEDDFPALGLRLAESGSRRLRRLRPRDPVRGLVVTGVTPGGPADQGGIEAGMVVTDVAGRRVETLGDARKALAERPKDRDLLIRVLRGPKAEFRVIPEPGPERRPDPPAPDGGGKDGGDEKGRDGPKPGGA